jgi:hypothetical protein
MHLPQCCGLLELLLRRSSIRRLVLIADSEHRHLQDTACRLSALALHCLPWTC